MAALGENLKNARKKKGMTQEQVAILLNVRTVTIASYERGLRRPDPDTLMKLSLMYNVSTDYLLGIPPSTEQTSSCYQCRAVPIYATIHYANGSVIFDDYEGDKVIYFSDDELEHKDDTFLWRVQDDRMLGDRIGTGDLALIQITNDVESGTIAAVNIENQDGTLYRVIKKPDLLILQPSNPKYETLFFYNNEKDHVHIIGQVRENIIEFPARRPEARHS